MSCYQPPGCDPVFPVNLITQAVRDALAERIIELQGYSESAKKSAEDAALSVLSIKNAEQVTLGYRDQTQVIANQVTKLLPKINETITIVDDTYNNIIQLSDAVSGLMTKTFYYTVLGGENTIVVPDSYKANSVKALYIEGSRQDPGYGFTFNRTTQTINLSEYLPAEAVGTTITIQVGTLDEETPDTLAGQLTSSVGATLVGTESGSNVQSELDRLNSITQVTTWFYIIKGGESTIQIPNEVSVSSVPVIYIEGSRQDIGYGFNYDSSSRTITLAESLSTDATGSLITVIISPLEVDLVIDALSQLGTITGASLVKTSSGQSIQLVLDSVLERLSALESR